MTVYITTPIYYPNDKPHLGHAYTTIAADILARWHKLHKKQVFFLTGTDEHGKKIQETATKNGKQPKEFIDNLIPVFKEAWQSLNIEYDRFIRTTDEDHEQVVKHLLKLVHDKGFIYKGAYEGLYCTGCEAYYTEKEAVNGCCPIHNRPLEILKEESYFFKLSQFQNKLIEHFEKNPEFVQPEGRKNEILSRIKEELKDLSISRNKNTWGIPIPFDNEHVTYVWFDALPNYLTGVGYHHNEKLFSTFWPAHVHLVGKDILWFHAVIWPAMLMAADLPLPRQIFAHGWWTVNDQKMGKSAGNALSVPQIISYAGVDPIRYFLFRETPFGAEGNFSKENLLLRYETELANKYGNLCSRLSNPLIKFGVSGTLQDDLDFAVTQTKVSESFEKLAYHEVLSHIFAFIDKTNEYIQTKQPWTTKDVNVLVTAFIAMKRATILLHPFMPQTTQKVADTCHFALSYDELQNTRAPKEVPSEKLMLFPKIET